MIIIELILFTGIQATGKSSFYKQCFYNTHIRINLDMLRTRNRENILIEACLKAKQGFVIDNTNPTAELRAKYIQKAKLAGFKTIGYYFKSSISDCLERNLNRENKVPDVAIKSTHTILELPTLEEGFEELYYVQIINNEFKVEVFNSEI